MAAVDCAPQFREFQWLPETAKALIAASLSPKDAVSLALTCKDLRGIARPFTAREFACKACGARLFTPRALIPCTTRPPPPPSSLSLSPAGAFRSSSSGSSRASPAVLLFPSDASASPPAGAPAVPLLLLLDDGAAACVQGGEVGEGGAIRALHSNVPFIAVPRLSWGRACAHLMDAATLHCARCLLFLGIQVRTVFPRLAASPSPPSSASPSPSPALAPSHLDAATPPRGSSPTAASPALLPSAPPSSRDAASAPSAHAHATAAAGAAGGAAQQQGLYAAEAKAFLVRKYLDLVRPDSYPGLARAAPAPPPPMPPAEPLAVAAAAEAAAVAAGRGGQGRVHLYADGLSGEGDGRHAVLCSGRRGHVGGGSGAQGKAPCLNVLFHSHQVLSARHCWDAGSGTEVAVYCNALHPGAFLLAPPRTEELAQGAMQIADVACARCRAPIGWKFCSLGGHGTDLRNLNQVGRFGIVLSSIHRGKEFLPAWRAAS
ncbi:unnamed protein product [Closterium sp. Yama58-4]|nr:unnamed protein product [Closterium sp. Yama58-4]